MIDFIALENFQSHENSRLDFVPGINALIGQSGNGKTAVFRGLDWIRKNRPMGKGFISYWNRNKHGDPINPTLVRVKSNSDWEITRMRSADFNGYLLHHFGDFVKELEATGTSVPDEISQILNLSDVNVQRVRDLPFLLAGSSGEAARFFNKIIRLDNIDTMLSAVNSLHQETKSAITTGKQKIKEYQQKIKNYSWVSKADLLLSKATQLDSNIKKQKDIYEKILCLLEEFKEQNIITQGYSFLNKACMKASLIDEKKAIVTRLQRSKRKLSDLLSEYKELQKELVNKPDLEIARVKVNQVEALFEKITKHKKTQKNIKNLLAEYKTQKEVIAECAKYLPILTKMLPDVCPLCNSSLKKNK